MTPLPEVIAMCVISAAACGALVALWAFYAWMSETDAMMEWQDESEANS